MTFAEVSFGFGFTLVVSALSILGYEYLKDSTSQHLISLLLPIIFLAVVWFVCITYTYVGYLKFNEKTKREDLSKESGENEIIKEAKLKITKRTVYILVEIVFLIFIILDYFGIFLIQ